MEPQYQHLFDGHLFVTDGGMETDLIFHHGVDLPAFAAFPLLDSAAGRSLLSDYYAGYQAVASAASAGLMLESPTWRANPDWGALVGYDAEALTRVNRDAIGFLRALANRWAGLVPATRLNGMIGPRGDGYRSDGAMSADQSAAYHHPQIQAFADVGADLVTAYTLTYAAEGAGVALAAGDVGIPVAISFTVETDGLLPDGSTLAAAIESVDATCRPAWFLVNCAHPDHIACALGGDGAWRERIRGVRVNASRLSHAELDEASELDDGDPIELACATDQLRSALPNLAIIGGCCGTDARHVAAQWQVADA